MRSLNLYTVFLISASVYLRPCYTSAHDSRQNWHPFTSLASAAVRQILLLLYTFHILILHSSDHWSQFDWPWHLKRECSASKSRPKHSRAGASRSRGRRVSRWPTAPNLPQCSFSSPDSSVLSNEAILRFSHFVIRHIPFLFQLVSKVASSVLYLLFLWTYCNYFTWNV